MNVEKLAKLTAPLKGYVFTIEPTDDGEFMDMLTVWDGQAWFSHYGSRILPKGDQVVRLTRCDHRDWVLGLGVLTIEFSATPAKAIQRLLKLVKALEASGFLTKGPEDFRPYITRDPDTVVPRVVYLFPVTTPTQPRK